MLEHRRFLLGCKDAVIAVKQMRATELSAYMYTYKYGWGFGATGFGDINTEYMTKLNYTSEETSQREKCQDRNFREVLLPLTHHL
jgi:hypothetical protein